MATTTNTADANKALGVAGMTGIFIDRDPSVLDRLPSNDYRQHNPRIANGTAALKALMGKLPSDFKYEAGLVMVDGDYASIPGVISVIRSSYRRGYRPGEPIGSAASRRRTKLRPWMPRDDTPSPMQPDHCQSF